jgi:flagellar basal body rod protein FlgC
LKKAILALVTENVKEKVVAKENVNAKRTKVKSKAKYRRRSTVVHKIFHAPAGFL